MQVLIEERRLEALEKGISEILGKLSEPVARVEQTEGDFLTIAKTAKALGWSSPKVFQEMKAGNIRSHRVHGRTVIVRTELIEDIKKFPG